MSRTPRTARTVYVVTDAAPSRAASHPPGAGRMGVRGRALVLAVCLVVPHLVSLPCAVRAVLGAVAAGWAIWPVLRTAAAVAAVVLRTAVAVAAVVLAAIDALVAAVLGTRRLVYLARLLRRAVCDSRPPLKGDPR